MFTLNPRQNAKTANWKEESVKTDARWPWWFYWYDLVWYIDRTDFRFRDWGFSRWPHCWDNAVLRTLLTHNTPAVWQKPTQRQSPLVSLASPPASARDWRFGSAQDQTVERLYCRLPRHGFAVHLYSIISQHIVSVGWQWGSIVLHFLLKVTKMYTVLI